MSELLRRTSSEVMRLPEPRGGQAISVREATSADLPFVDHLQKMHSHMVGFLRLPDLERKIKAGNIIIAETSQQGPIGYCVFQDQYLKRDDVGVIYQLNVLPLKQRHLVGATLVKGAFERAAYGCKLFCCWCAQDIQANWFWESIGFVPLAFRTGSRSKQRIHVFWQKRIREHDVTTPYWFPSKTSGGGVNEDRLVLPIPVDAHWRDVKPLVLPGGPGMESQQTAEQELPRTLPGGALVKSRPEQDSGHGGAARVSKAQMAAVARSKSKHLNGCPTGKAAVITAGGVRYVDRADAAMEEAMSEPVKVKKKRASSPRRKHDPKYEKAARDLRDQYLEAINSGALLPSGCDAEGSIAQKYEVARQLPAPAPGSAPAPAPGSAPGREIEAEVVEGRSSKRVRLLEAA